MLSLVFISLLRLSKRIILESGKNAKYKNTLIIGANSSINSLLHDKKNLEYTPVAIVDGSELLIGTYILNLKVYSFEDLKRVIKSKSIEAVIISKDYSLIPTFIVILCSLLYFDIL
jgi:FlaA1/EpsC-like NDP-sugar epimerase